MLTCGLLAVLALTAGRPARQLNIKADQELEIVVDTTHPLGAISPLIYGMASPSAEHYKQLRVPVARWGGNPSTRYNWEQGNSWNAARDWKFANGNYGIANNQPSGCADNNIRLARANGAEFLLTIPTMGWVARDSNPRHASLNVPLRGEPPIAPGSEAIAGYDPAQNRRQVSLRSLPRKNRPFSDPPNLTDDVMYQDEWVAHLTRTFGGAAKGGVRFYAMDNEPDLWDVTHTDMHPVQPDYDEILQKFLATAEAVKDVDGGAQITGPVSWGWTGYFYSPRDRGADSYAAHPDRRAHGNLAFVPWFLQQTAQRDRKTGRRTLDVLDAHFYPQAEGVYAGKTDAATNALRLRSTRALWDAAYRDESWIAAPIQLLPRLRGWIEQYYPGTRLALTEWNWGAETTLNGGLAAAEVLGILGRERVDMACYWTSPPVGSPAFFAFKMYRNVDGKGNGFGDVALAARSEAPDVVSCYASRDSRNGTITALLINKGAQRNVTVQLRGASRRAMQQNTQVWRYDGANLKSIAQYSDITLREGAANLLLPPSSLTLLRCGL